jgi:6-phosphogluconolactonase
MAFDVMLLGLGEDAHIASIFPGSEWLAGTNSGHPFAGRRVAAVWAPHLNAWRITLTPAAIHDSRAIAVLVAGARKANAVHAAIEAPLDVERTPAQLLREVDDVVEWLLDPSAASLLTT